MSDFNRENEQYTPGTPENNSSYDDIYSSKPEQQYVSKASGEAQAPSSDPAAEYAAPENTQEAQPVQNTYPQTDYQQPVQNTYPQTDYQQPVQNTYPQTDYQQPAQNIYSQPQTPVPYSNPYSSQQVQPPIYNADYTRPQNNAADSAADSAAAPPPKKKKGKTAKRIAVIVCAIILAAGVGLGGGFLGSMLASNSSVATSSESGNSSESEGSESSKSGGSLTINKAEGTEVSATTVQEVVEKAADSVVEITTESVTTGQYMQQYVSTGAGSGVIISEDGYIITNNHVIENANTITVTLKDDSTYTATLIGTDSQVDIALLKIDATGLTPATFGDSDKLSVGETAVAIGNPLGKLGGTVTNGIISALDREITIDGETMNLFQTNAAINPGNSGGGIFNANAELVGIVVAKSSGTDVEGLGFAIPINDVVDILQDLLDYGYVTGRPSLGVTLTNVSEDNLFSYRLSEAGTYVASVTSGSAADNAGIETGDMLVKIGDTEVTSASQATNLISEYKAGDKVNITIKRDGKEQTLEVTLDEEKSSTSSSAAEQSSTTISPYQYFG